jgi:hypothetical protein
MSSWDRKGKAKETGYIYMNDLLEFLLQSTEMEISACHFQLTIYNHKTYAPREIKLATVILKSIQTHKIQRWKFCSREWTKSQLTL